MTLWVILTIMTSVTAVFVSVPFLRRFGDDSQSESASNIAVYLDQLTELEKEAAAGLIEPDQAQAARAEIRRRVLVADRARKPFLARLSPVERNLAVVAVAGLVILGSVGLYAVNGSPTSPSAPAASERSRGPSAVEELAAATVSQPLDVQQQVPSPPRLGTVDEMMARLVERLKEKPDDAEGWRMLGWSYFNTDRFAQSAEAYAKALKLRPSDASLSSAHGEALVRAADDRVTEEAKAIFIKTLQLDPKDARAQFFIGLAKQQGGDGKSALEDWISILNEADGSEPWLSDLRQRVTELAQETGADVSTRLPQKAATTGGVLHLLKQQEAQVANQRKDGPTAEDVRNADAMTPNDRAAMIHNMVDGLAARLEQSPNDVEGWIKLIRARKVLGETDAAGQALKRALDVFKSEPQQRGRIVAIGQEMGLTQ
jgi:cytochrome c-type biogenesis protein CcmH